MTTKNFISPDLINDAHFGGADRLGMTGYIDARGVSIDVQCYSVELVDHSITAFLYVDIDGVDQEIAVTWSVQTIDGRSTVDHPHIPFGGFDTYGMTRSEYFGVESFIEGFAMTARVCANIERKLINPYLDKLNAAA